MKSRAKKKAASGERGEKKENSITQKSLGQQDYTVYKFSGTDKQRFLLKSIVIAAGGAYFFYRSPSAVIIFLLLLPLYYQKEKQRLGRKKRQELRLAFKEAILSVAVNLKAGYAVENAFIEAKRDMELLYGEESDISRELGIIVSAVGSNIPLEKALLDFGLRSGVSEIMDFAEVFAIGKRSSGEITEMVEKTAALIGLKIEAKREIETVMSAKVLEQKAMSMVPFMILIYVNITSPGFFTPLYGNPAGAVIMTGCLLLYMFSLAAAEKITKIEV